MEGKLIGILISILLIANVLTTAVAIDEQRDPVESEIIDTPPGFGGEPDVLRPMDYPLPNSQKEGPEVKVDDEDKEVINIHQDPTGSQEPEPSEPYRGSPGSPEPASDPPVAKAGDDQIVLEGDTVYFDGSASYKPGGSIDYFQWDFDASVDADRDGNSTNDFEGYGPQTTHIYGDNGVYDVILRVQSKGSEGGSSQTYQDVVFCADNSGSMSQDSVDLLKDGLKVYVAEMSMPDHGAVITFGGGANLLNPLTEDYDQLKADIVSIPGPGGGTYMVSALGKAMNEIAANGHSNHTRVIILQTDGQPTDGDAQDVIDKAKIAASNDILIYTIGLEPAPGFQKLDEDLLKEVANVTGGKYYYAPKAEFLATIYKEIAQLVEKPGESPSEDTDTMQVIVKNLEPDIYSISSSTPDLGIPTYFYANVSDLGSDDLYLVWNWDDGTADTLSTYYNNGVSPDPYPSPSVNPMDISHWTTHTFTSAGNYVVTLTVYDDDNGTCQNPLNIDIFDSSLIADFTWAPEPQDEGSPVQFTDISTYSSGLNVSYQWDLAGQGTSNAHNPQFTFMDDGIYPVTLTLLDHTGNTASATYNITILDLAPTAEFVGSPDPQNENSPVVFADMSTSYPDDIVAWTWDFGDGNTSSLRNTSHTYGDDGIFAATLTVTDEDNSTDSVTHNVTVINVDPTITIESVIMDVEIGLRVSGRKYNKVMMSLFEEGSGFGYAEIERIPGSPNEQVVWIPKVLDMTRSYSARLNYVPVDPPEIGANPVWVLIKFKNGTVHKIHHTFNVQQSIRRDSHHWNHIEPWDVDLNAHLVGWAFEVHYHVTDVGSDDEILTFSYGTQNVVVLHLNSPPGFDAYPSPEINPVDILDFAELIYEGPGTLTLTAHDDDNIRTGIGEDSDTIDLG